jgi:DNA-binding winged helix-turn-helix (wHTH) protein/TolB-like protein/tetratricopeptide (TPR) repeat protein
MTHKSRCLYDFGPFRIDPAERLVLREGHRVRLTPKAFDTLLVLVQNAGHLVDKSELMQAVWGDSFVEEGILTVEIAALRKALRDNRAKHRYIETVAKQGYRFVHDVHEVQPHLAQASISSTIAPSSEVPVPSMQVQSGSVAIAAARLGVLSSRKPLPITMKVAVSLLLLVGVVAGSLRFRGSTGAQTRIHSLAVLPFQTLGPDPTASYLGLGFADAIITKLGSTGEIVVRPTSAMMKYAPSSTDPRAAGREQGVDAILVGRVEAGGSQIRVTAQLVCVKDGNLLWADTFVDDRQQMFALQARVAEGVARSMAMVLSTGARMRLAQPDTQNSKAYELYLEGRYFWNRRTPEGLRRSIDYLKQATTEDPNYALAYSGLADAYVLLDLFGVEPWRQAYPNAKAAALNALRLDDSLAEAHSSLGMLSLFYEWDWTRAEHEFKRAIDLNPNYALAHDWYASDLLDTGRCGEALEQARRAQELDPLSFVINGKLGRAYYSCGQYHQAITTLQRVVDLDPNYARARARLGVAYLASQSFAEAIRQLRVAQRLSATDPNIEALFGYAEARSGDPEAARQTLTRLVERSHHEYVPAFNMALICVGLGDIRNALDWLEKAYQERDTQMMYVKTDPLLEPLHSNPRFGALLRRMQLF